MQTSMGWVSDGWTWEGASSQCKVYTKIKGKEKLMALKLDNLWKHGGRKKK
jgi:uncharacterized membrane protein